jgi:hypothetical protein
MIITPELCKKCIYYFPIQKTCKHPEAVIILSKSTHFYDFAKNMRLGKKCGPDAKLFKEKEVS